MALATVCFKQVVDGDRAVGMDVVAALAFEHGIAGGARVVDGAFEGFVDAVLAPGLGEGFEFDVGGLAVLVAVVLLDALHLFEREEEVAVAAEGFEAGVVEITEGDTGQFEVLGGAALEGGGVVGVGVDFLNDGVAQAAGGEGLGVAGRWLQAR